jgi:dipeptidyl aminopeptidase/acylaminoacyl peptidase
VPTFQQLTFRRGYVLNARFSPDGRTIAYDAYWDGNPPQLFTFRTGGAESSPLGLVEGNLLSISRSDEIAALVRSLPVGAFAANGTLARMALGGGPPREVLENVQEADWSPDGLTLAIVRRVGDRSRIEYPAGNVLYATAGWVSHARISPDGSRIAFVDHPEYGNDSGSIAVVDLKGRKSTLSRHWATALGLAWDPPSGEVWFTAAPEGVQRALYATTLSGRERTILRVPGSLRLHDIFPDGRVLIAQEAVRGGMLAVAPRQTKERDFSWQDFSFAVDLCNDGTMVLICDQGTGAGSSSSSAYVRAIDGSPAVRLGDGVPFAFSPDAKWALALLPAEQQLVLLPTGAGEARHLSRGRIEKYETFGGWSADGNRILFHGREAGHGTRLYVQPIDGEPTAISPEGIRVSQIGHDLSPDGRWAFARDPAGKAVLYPVDGGEPKMLPAVDPGEDPIGWDFPGRAVYLIRPTSLPSLVYRVDLASQQKVVWKDLTPSDRAGIIFSAAALARDGKAYVYNFIRTLSDLYMVTGLR